MSETRALLLSDVVESTKLSEALGDAAMAALWERHDRVASDLLPVHRCREIDKTDGFLHLFDQAGDAREALGPHQNTRRIESHGHWRLKGVTEPIELYEVGGTDGTAPFTPPPDCAKVYRVVRQGEHWPPVKQVKHSLPGERDAFVGRRADLDLLARRFDEGAGLVSMLGQTWTIWWPRAGARWLEATVRRRRPRCSVRGTASS